ncbi:MAG: GAF domain-containing protein [Cyanobacteria bacterium Co-bin13]|nr:GAF domain-containing protein [Cyanobacteria bacterium Co-bin13]
MSTTDRPSRTDSSPAVAAPSNSNASLGRSSEQIKAEIAATFGFVPPFFEPAESSQVLENLWQQTLTAYVHNPLPALFKEKLSAYLSRFCNVPYCMVCHSCSLRPLGLKARQVLDLLDAPPPVETDITKHLTLLAGQPESLQPWVNADSPLEESLLYCAIFIGIEHTQADFCRQELRRLLGAVTYQHLVTFIAYTKFCHAWIEAHPEVTYEADQRAQENLGALLLEEPDLEVFFRDYRNKVKHENQSRAAQLLELAERKRREEELRQQMERERLVAEIAQRIRRSLNLDDILHTTVSEVQQFLQADRALIYRFEPDWSGIVAVESVVPGCLSIQSTRIKDSFFVSTAGRELYKQGQVHAVDDVYTANLSECHRELLTQLQIRANLVVPIVQGEKLWGLLVVNSCLEPRQWQPLDLTLLKHLATQLAIAIQQSELYQKLQVELNERQRSEEKNRQQAALLDITSDAIFVLNLDSQVLFWNKGAETLYGWSSEAALSQRIDQLLHANQAYLKTLATLADTGTWRGELQHTRKDGKTVIVDSRWTLMQPEDQAHAILVVNTDITQQKQREQQALHSQRLEILGTLATGIAHDLNNVFTPILGIAQLLQLKLMNTDQSTQELLQLQEANVKRGAALVKRVLSFAHKTPSKPAVLEIEAVVLELVQTARETFPKSIDVQTEIEPHLWPVFADVTELHQVLLNLCVNARDAMPQGGRLTIKAENVVLDETDTPNPDARVGPYVAVTVADTGTGIAPDVLERIFEPFFTTKALDRGTGLGLSTVMGIVKNQGGFIDVHSQIGQGTQFKVYLPMHIERYGL